MSTEGTAALLARLPALSVPNFRRYLVGQGASIAGTWLQTVALGWLVLRITDNGASVGIVTAAQFVPALVLGAWAGSLADRYDARRAVLALQVLLFAQAAALTLLVVTHHETLLWLCALAVVQGVGNAFDPPIRQGLMNDLVGDQELASAVAMNSTIVQLGLVIGPSLAAVLIPSVGLAWCFAVNAMSYIVMFAAIRSVRTAEMINRPRATGSAGSVLVGLGHVARRPDLTILLGTVAAGSLIAYRLEVVVPLLARREFHGGARLFSVMTVLRGAGSLVGSAWLATRRTPPSKRLFVGSSAILALSLALMATPSEAVVFAALIGAGVGMLISMVSTLAMVQLDTAAELRGRVVALWFVAMNAGVVFGAPLTGWLSDHIGIRSVLLCAAGSMMIAAANVWRFDRVRRPPLTELGPSGDR